MTYTTLTNERRPTQVSSRPVRCGCAQTSAARRKTTRVEDVAYSLMGIFDVSLPICYREGGDRVFYMLIEATMQAKLRNITVRVLFLDHRRASWAIKIWSDTPSQFTIGCVCDVWHT
ncbi:hypothetical protein DFH29DRAFT_159007 [Suillus ampliporus]|nr:hypothetical protein DFH29DRAFT_159007 [Suillus ampliporus]